MENGRPAGPPEALEGVYAETVHRDAGFVMPRPHCHPYFELFYVESGSCRFFIENNLYDIYPGDFMLIPPEVFHSTRYPSGPCRRDALHFVREDLDRSVAALMPGEEGFFAAVRLFQTPEALRERIGAHFARMVGEQRLGDARSGPMLRVLLQELLLLCGRECRFLDGLPEGVHTTDRQIVQAARYISGHYMEPVKAADIAAAAGYSPNYLSRKFRRSVGLGLHEYLVFIRLQHAASQLVTTADSITDIAFRCGFSDSNYFKDAFKKSYGVTPRAYRRRL